MRESSEYTYQDLLAITLKLDTTNEGVVLTYISGFAWINVDTGNTLCRKHEKIHLVLYNQGYIKYIKIETRQILKERDGNMNGRDF